MLKQVLLRIISFWSSVFRLVHRELLDTYLLQVFSLNTGKHLHLNFYAVKAQSLDLSLMGDNHALETLTFWRPK